MLPWRKILAREGLDTSDDIENDDDEDPGSLFTLDKRGRCR